MVPGADKNPHFVLAEETTAQLLYIPFFSVLHYTCKDILCQTLVGFFNSQTPVADWGLTGVNIIRVYRKLCPTRLNFPAVLWMSESQLSHTTLRATPGPYKEGERERESGDYIVRVAVGQPWQICPPHQHTSCHIIYKNNCCERPQSARTPQAIRVKQLK